MFRQTVWTPRDSNTYADDDWSDAHPSPLHPSYNDASPSSNWLSPVAVGDDADNLFDLTQTNDFISLLDDSSSRHEQQHMLRRWMTPAAKSNPRALSRQSTLDDVVIAGGWEEKIVRRWQRKHGLQGLTLREVKREMPPIEFDPAFADSDTEDEDEEPFNPDMLVDPPMRVVAPHFPSPISIPGSGPFPSDAPLSPLTPLSSEPQRDFSIPALSPSPPPALIPARALTPPESAADPSPAPERASSPMVKQESEDISPPSRASSPLKRTFSEAIQDAENVLADDATSEEGEYVPSDDEEDDADPTYGAPKARRVSSSHGSGHARTPSNADKPARAGPGRRRRLVDDAAPSQCTYENPMTGSRCQQIFARLPEMKRHIDHFHHEQEARAVMEGKLPRERATLLGPSWDGTLGKPTCEGCGTEFSRRDAVKRHQNEVKAQFEDGRCVWCPGTQGRKGSAKRVAAAKLASGSASKRQRRK